jgi:hypothetical protein
MDGAVPSFEERLRDFNFVILTLMYNSINRDLGADLSLQNYC